MHITNPAEAKSQRFANCPKNRYVFKGNVCKPCLLIISDGNKKSFHVPITLITATVIIIVLIKGSTIEINRRMEPHPSIVAASSNSSGIFFMNP